MLALFRWTPNVRRERPQIFPIGMDMSDLHALAVNVATGVLARHTLRV
jgi:hypothetical protein